MDLDSEMSVTVFLRKIMKRLDGVLLILLIGLFVAFTIFPALVALLGLVPSVDVATEMRLTFLMMPVALVAEYVWFLSSTGSRQHSLLLCVVLLVTASIPFFNVLKGSLQ